MYFAQILRKDIFSRSCIARYVNINPKGETRFNPVSLEHCISLQLADLDFAERISRWIHPRPYLPYN